MISPSTESKLLYATLVARTADGELLAVDFVAEILDEAGRDSSDLAIDVYDLRRRREADDE